MFTTSTERGARELTKHAGGGSACLRSFPSSRGLRTVRTVTNNEREKKKPGDVEV